MHFSQYAAANHASIESKSLSRGVVSLCLLLTLLGAARLSAGVVYGRLSGNYETGEKFECEFTQLGVANPNKRVATTNTKGAYDVVLDPPDDYAVCCGRQGENATKYAAGKVRSHERPVRRDITVQTTECDS